MVAAHASADGEALLDWNECPIGPPPQAVKRIIDAAERLHRYPRGLLEEVTALTAAHFGVTPGQVLLTAGVDEAVDITLALAARACALRPGFDGYQDRAVANGKPFRHILLGPDWQPPAAPDPAIGEGDIVYLAEPNNPTGTLLPGEWVDALLASPAHVVIDETYQEFSGVPSVLDRVARQGPRLMVYRSFSKAAGLAGIRLGCLIGDERTIGRLEPLRRFMPIDAVSLNAAAGYLEEPEFMDQIVAHIRRGRPALCAMLRDSGLFCEVRNTRANFAVAKPAPRAREILGRQLGLDRIRVKDCAAFGLDGWIRVNVGSWSELKRLRDSLQRAAAQLAMPGAGNLSPPTQEKGQSDAF